MRPVAREFLDQVWNRRMSRQEFTEVVGRTFRHIDLDIEMEATVQMLYRDGTALHEHMEKLREGEGSPAAANARLGQVEQLECSFTSEVKALDELDARLEGIKMNAYSEIHSNMMVGILSGNAPSALEHFRVAPWVRGISTQP